MKLKTILAAATVATGMVAGAAQASTIDFLHATQIDVGRADVAGVGFEAEVGVKDGDRNNPANALGAPDSGTSGEGFFSLGLGGVAVFGFGEQFTDTAGVFEVTFGCGSSTGVCTDGHEESVDVYAFEGDYTAFDTGFGLLDILSLGFTYQGSIDNGAAQGGDTVTIGGPFDFLALVDTSSATGGSLDGFDVDAVTVQAVPLPASALFLLAGLGGLGVMRKRKAA